jgi:hypothetical protein
MNMYIPSAKDNLRDEAGGAVNSLGIEVTGHVLSGQID